MRQNKYVLISRIFSLEKYSSCLEFRAARSHNMFGSVAQFMWRPSVAHNLRLCFSTSPALFTKRKILLWFPLILFPGIAFSLFFYACWFSFLKLCFSKHLFFNLVLWELNTIQLHLWNILQSPKSKPKDKEKVKALWIGHKNEMCLRPWAAKSRKKKNRKHEEKKCKEQNW